MVTEPAAAPVTSPVTASTVAMAVLLLLQLPPPLPVLVNAVLEPSHKVAAPLTVPEFGSAFTVIPAEAVAVPQVLETV